MKEDFWIFHGWLLWRFYADQIQFVLEFLQFFLSNFSHFRVIFFVCLPGCENLLGSCLNRFRDRKWVSGMNSDEWIFTPWRHAHLSESELLWSHKHASEFFNFMSFGWQNSFSWLRFPSWTRLSTIENETRKFWDLDFDGWDNFSTAIMK